MMNSHVIYALFRLIDDIDFANAPFLGNLLPHLSFGPSPEPSLEREGVEGAIP